MDALDCAAKQYLFGNCLPAALLSDKDLQGPGSLPSSVTRHGRPLQVSILGALRYVCHLGNAVPEKSRISEWASRQNQFPLVHHFRTHGRIDNLRQALMGTTSAADYLCGFGRTHYSYTKTSEAGFDATRADTLCKRIRAVLSL
jgi:hypothetical protein